MVMVVANASFEAGRRSCGLNTSNEALGVQNSETVVHRLKRDRADLLPDGLRHGVGGDVGPTGNGPQNRQSLGGYLNAALPKKLRWIDSHAKMLSDI
jgi:hypothetical protein